MKANVAFLVGGENGDIGGKPLRAEVENQKTQRMRVRNRTQATLVESDLLHH